MYLKSKGHGLRPQKQTIPSLQVEIKIGKGVKKLRDEIPFVCSEHKFSSLFVSKSHIYKYDQK